ncbi:hypothetical protein [Phnomibacter sp. MR]|uniref:hypothetical protein n=1 Tax=Phnomibacter sp. MR TaxID=3042318 RepID=UPI003A7FB693
MQLSLRNWIGLAVSVTLIASCFMHWTWYPDIQKYFTGFFTEKNYYGKPAYFLVSMGSIGVLAHAYRKVWLYRVNLAASGLAMAFAIRTFLLFTSSYDGYIPEKQLGIYVMLFAAILNIVTAMTSMDKKPTAKS